MLDDFWSGIFGGIFGRDVVRFLWRYKLRTVFFLVVVGFDLFFLFVGVRSGGWQYALRKMLTPVGIFVPIGLGLLCVITLALCAPNAIGKYKDDSKNDKK